MSDKKRLVYSILQFINDEITTGLHEEDTVESLEVAKQCLETAYMVTLNDEEFKSSKSLLECLREANKAEETKPKKIPTLAEKVEAEELKTQGNNLMKEDKYDEAIKCYTKAIELDGTNPVYFCNRAAAQSKVNDHEMAIEDCRNAVSIDPLYSKAYGRMGLAYSSICEYEQARKCYQKATELDPTNESYQSNLQTVEQKINELNMEDGASSPGGMGGLGGLDFSQLMGNPAIMNMAQSLMSSPQMQEMMTGFLRNAGGGPGVAPGGEGAQPPPPSGGMGDLFRTANQQAGQPQDMGNLLRTSFNLAQQMQQNNPDLVEQLRQNLSNSGANQSSSQDKNDPPPQQ